jgi:hypothetical protein
MEPTQARQTLQVLTRCFKPRPIVDPNTQVAFIALFREYDPDVAMLAIEGLDRHHFPTVSEMRAQLDWTATQFQNPDAPPAKDASWRARGRWGVAMARAALEAASVPADVSREGWKLRSVA